MVLLTYDDVPLQNMYEVIKQPRLFNFTKNVVT